MGDFNAHSYDSVMKDFIKVNGLIKLVKGNTYFKGQGSCIDLEVFIKTQTFTKLV